MKMGSAGTLMLWLKGELPEGGWLWCDGKVYHQSVSPELHFRLRSLPGAHAASDPPEMFRVPDDTKAIPPQSLLRLIIKT